MELYSVLWLVLVFVSSITIKNTTLCEHHKVSSLILEYPFWEQPIQNSEGGSPVRQYNMSSTISISSLQNMAMLILSYVISFSQVIDLVEYKAEDDDDCYELQNILSDPHVAVSCEINAISFGYKNVGFPLSSKINISKFQFDLDY